MAYRVTVRQEEDRLPDGLAVGEDETILEAALAAGLPYPHGCRQGDCGSCKSELLSGRVDMLPWSDHALTEDERAGGRILACRARPRSDCAVAWVEDSDTEVHLRRRLVCRVVALEAATHDVRIMRLAVEAGGPFRFAAGQYASVAFDGLPPRDYSMASRPDENEIEFHIRLMPGGAVTPYVSGELAVGHRIAVEGPIGGSYLRKHHRGPIVAMGGGSGIAPMKSIVETALGRGMTQDIHLYMGVRAERDVYLEDRFNTLAAGHSNLHFEIVLSEPGPDGNPKRRRTGLLHEALAADHRDLSGAKIYLAGPPAMVEAATATARRLGVRREDCHADAFYTEADREKLEAERTHTGLASR